MPTYSTRLRFLKPYFGTRRCNGIWPPSNPIFVLYPERDFAPLCPRVAVPPRPDPVPRPTRFLFFIDPSAGFRLLKFIFTIHVVLYLRFHYTGTAINDITYGKDFPYVNLLHLFYGYKVIYLTHHTDDGRRSLHFHCMIDSTQSQCL